MLATELELELAEHGLEETDLCVLEERERKLWVLEEKGSLENVLEGLGEPAFDKEVLGWSFYSDCVNLLWVCNKVQLIDLSIWFLF